MEGRLGAQKSLILVILTSMVLLLYFLGRDLWCPAGDLSFWSVDVNSQHNSQHFLDWYTPSHISHGLIFFYLFQALLRGEWKSFGFACAVALEAGWEILENTNFIIDRYREATMAFNYRGDSILNSLADVAWCSLGYYIAARIKLGHTILLFLGFELFTLYFIRDNLTLNVLMLIWPIEGIKEWQGG